MKNSYQIFSKNLKFLSFCLFLLVFFVFSPVLAKAEEPEVSIRDTSYAAKFVSQSEKDPIIIEAGKTKTIILKFKNVGQSVWDSAGDNYLSAYTMEPRNRFSVFKGKNWLGKEETAAISGKIKPGQVGELKIDLQAPQKIGDYLEKFYLASENTTWVEGGYFFLKIKVSTNSPSTNNTPTNLSNTNNTNPINNETNVEPISTSTSLIMPEVTSTENNLEVVTSTILVTSSSEFSTTSTSSTLEPVINNGQLIEEPNIRVGIWKPQSWVQFKSSDDDYFVYDGADLVGTLHNGYLGVFNYEDGLYTFTGNGINLTTKNFIRLVPINNPQAIFELLNFDNQVKWRGGSRNFNKYRGGIEYHLDNGGGKMYVINDLLFEDYVKGIAEASDVAPKEFLKAQVIAARTYAYFTQQGTTKHDERNFDVSGTTGDQLYLGYVNEVLSPNMVEVASTTRGQMVTYNSKVVITPYFGHSNGKTRAYNTVWGGAVKPWLVPVKCKYDKGLTRYGHGVGMSQRDAALKAQKEGVDYLTLLKYYYTGTEIEKIY